MDVARFFGGRATCRAVLEAGTHSGWMHEKLVALGHEVLVANPRKVRMRGATNKNDQVDAEFLARMGRADAKLLYPLKPRERRIQEALAVVRSREQLVRTRQSGEQDPQLRIHKAGDPILRRILVQCANYILGPFGPDRLIARGGKNAKKRARVAVARKLATVPHALWVTDAAYDPDHRARPAA